MSASVARLIFCFAWMISLVIVFVVAIIALEDMDEFWTFLFATLLTAFAAVLGWCGIWYGAVKWTQPRLLLTFAVLIAAVFPGVVVGVLVVAIEDYMEEVAVMFGGMTWLVAFMIGTALVWQESAEERALRLSAMGIATIACPNCGYNLTGLKQSACPECGKQYTLDQLFASVAEQRMPDRGSV